MFKRDMNSILIYRHETKQLLINYINEYHDNSLLIVIISYELMLYYLNRGMKNTLKIVNICIIEKYENLERLYS